MTVRPITIVGHRALEQRTRKVREITEDSRTLVADMFETNDAADGAGLAAPQVGSRWRLFIYSCPDSEGIERRGVVINPRLERYGPLELEEDTIEGRSEEHTSELQSRGHLVCRLLLEKKKIDRLIAPTAI